MIITTSWEDVERLLTNSGWDGWGKQYSTISTYVDLEGNRVYHLGCGDDDLVEAYLSTHHSNLFVLWTKVGGLSPWGEMVLGKSRLLDED